ncbi:DUF2815 family protein [Fusobacterium varium]|jgi:hypothetical protein|uniref:DUF2815 family protein n=1 Tax=Fusobacterium varium TaxID=856 RepID=UPI001F3AD8EA|nr:DUF2815 family protein [Fusobacterium varium]MCF2674617.1 DUF2815 family protein [Fusobacterium varium]
MAVDIKATKVVTGECLLSYVNVFKPRLGVNGQPGKYGVTILIPKTDTATKARIDAAIKAAIEQAVTSKWNGQKPAKIAEVLHDGDGGRPSDGLPYGEECKGHWVLNASAGLEYPPKVFDKKVQPIIDQSEVYSGIYGIASINFYGYLANGKKGVSAGLNGIQKLRDGVPLSGAGNVAADFTATEDTQEVDPITGEPI